MLYSCKMCSHTVAVAYHTKFFQRYLKWMQKQKGSVSLSVLANANMPKGLERNQMHAISLHQNQQLSVSRNLSLKQKVSNLLRELNLVSKNSLPVMSTTKCAHQHCLMICLGHLNCHFHTLILHHCTLPNPHPSSSDYNQPLDHFGRQPPPLVSTGSLVQQVSMPYSPSANVVYAPVVSMSSSVDRHFLVAISEREHFKM